VTSGFDAEAFVNFYAKGRASRHVRSGRAAPQSTTKPALESR